MLITLLGDSFAVLVVAARLSINFSTAFFAATPAFIPLLTRR
jgi:hypothetical protein